MRWDEFCWWDNFIITLFFFLCTSRFTLIWSKNYQSQVIWWLLESIRANWVCLLLDDWMKSCLLDCFWFCFIFVSGGRESLAIWDRTVQFSAIWWLAIVAHHWQFTSWAFTFSICSRSNLSPSNLKMRFQYSLQIVWSSAIQMQYITIVTIKQIALDLTF